MALTTGNQLKAARALTGVDQQQLADAAGLNVNTIRNMEARGPALITSSAVTVHSVQVALEAMGVEFLNHARPGVRLNAPSVVSEQKQKVAANRARRKAPKAKNK
jgi:transcriptional regulator with XRE-family HTH domain